MHRRGAVGHPPSSYMDLRPLRVPVLCLFEGWIGRRLLGDEAVEKEPLQQLKQEKEEEVIGVAF